MRALPIILVVAALATACEFPQGTTVPKEEYDAVVNAYNDLKVSAEATRDSSCPRSPARRPFSARTWSRGPRG